MRLLRISPCLNGLVGVRLGLLATACVRYRGFGYTLQVLRILAYPCPFWAYHESVVWGYLSIPSRSRSL